MNLSSNEILRRLGAGDSIETVCKAAELSRAAFDAWWKAESAARVPSPNGTHRAAVRQSVQIERDDKGVPHIFAENDADLFFGFGYAMAQDRLFQLDYLRRRGSGRLSKILGPDGTELDLFARTVGLLNVFELDLLARTLGLRQIAEAEWDRLDAGVRSLVTAFTHGINAHLDEVHERLPIEFDLLDYRPEPWSPVDCLTIEGEFRWYLTGRFPVIVMPELAKRALGEGPLYKAFLETEGDAESILPPGSYPRRDGGQAAGAAAGDPDGGIGSNNWVVTGGRTLSGKPLLASDPHIPFDAVSCWYQVHLCGGSFNVAGMAYAGMPAVMFGRTERVAWGCTNNICSLRDLYLEKTDPAHPNCFLFDRQWEPAREREESISVKGGPPGRHTIRYSRNGPIVTDVLPPAARTLGPIALKWLGATEGGWLTALLAMDRATSAATLREATRPWHVPTFSVVFADTDGDVGYQATGRIPIRTVWERGFRPGWDPQHQWAGLIPFEGMPRWDNPARGWIATANNRVAPNDFAYPLSGTWSDGVRAGRIRQMIEAQTTFRFEDFVRMHADAFSLRAARCVKPLANVLAGSTDERLRAAVRRLESWNCRMDPDQVGATLFSVFFANWVKTVVRQRFTGTTAALLAGGATGLSAALLEADGAGWFSPGEREAAIRTTMGSVLASLSERLSPDLATWTWGRVHTLPLRHILSGRGDLAHLLDYGGLPVQGDLTTVCNTGLGGKYEARSGAGYRLIADLASAPPELWAIDVQGTSGHPGSRHYADQLPDWLHGRYHRLPLEPSAAHQAAVARWTLEP